MHSRINYDVRPPHHFRNTVVMIILAIVAVGVGAEYAKYRDNNSQQRTTQQATQPQHRNSNNINTNGSNNSNNKAQPSKANKPTSNQMNKGKITTNTPVNTNWRAGLPSLFSQNSYWISNFKPATHPNKKDVYERISSPMNSNTSFNPTLSMFNKNHKPTMNGADESAMAGMHPHFKSLGANKFIIAGGAKNLHNELYNSGQMFGNVDLIKVIDHNHFKLWMFDSNHMNKYYKDRKLDYMGTFTRYPHNRSILKKVLGM